MEILLLTAHALQIPDLVSKISLGLAFNQQIQLGFLKQGYIQQYLASNPSWRPIGRYMYIHTAVPIGLHRLIIELIEIIFKSVCYLETCL